MPIKVLKTDACSQWYNNRPFVFLTSDKQSAVRSRFDLAHELGHFFLHHIDENEVVGKSSYKRLEDEANRFAGAFLLPEKEFAKDLVSTSIHHFISLKQKWKVSIAGMIYRCKDLDLLSENQISYLWRQLSSNGYRKREPLDDLLLEEKPFMLKSAIELLSKENIINPIELNKKMNLPVDEISKMCNLPEKLFSNNLVAKSLVLRRLK